MNFAGSELGQRFYRLNKEMNVPLPTFSEDEVVDFFVKEAILVKGLLNEQERAKKQAMKEWRRGKPGSGPPPGM